MPPGLISPPGSLGPLKRPNCVARFLKIDCSCADLPGEPLPE